MGVKKSGTVCFVSGLSEFIPLVSIFIPSLSISVPSKGKNWLKNVLDFCTSLFWSDLDFKDRMIDVNHAFNDRPDETGKTRKRIQDTKTDAGTRTIPMIDEVYDAFLTAYEYQKILGFCEEEIDGYTGFVFITSQHTVILPEAVNRAIHCIVNKHNEEETLKAKEEGRKPILLPDFTAHVLRHTFCTRLCENESNTLFIKDVMGHADINTTMNIYADITNEKKKEVMSGLQGKII